MLENPLAEGRVDGNEAGLPSVFMEESLERRTRGDSWFSIPRIPKGDAMSLCGPVDGYERVGESVPGGDSALET